MNENEKILNSANEETAAKPAPKKKFGKKAILIAVAAVVVIAVVAAIAGAAVSSSPVALVGKGASNSISALQQNEAAAFLEQVTKGGSIEAVCDVEALLGLPVEGAVSLKMYVAAARAAITASIDVGGEAVADAGVFADEKNIAVVSDVLLGSTAYGIGLTDLTDRFNSSVFGPDGELSLGIELPEQTENVLADAAELSEDSQTVAKAMLSRMLEIVEEHAEVSKEKDTIDLGGAETKVTAVEVRIDSEAATAMITDLIEYLRSDAQLKEFLYKYADYFAAVLEESGLVYGDYEDGEEFLDEYYEQLEDIGINEMEELAEYLEEADLDVSLIFYITKSGKELVGIKFDGAAGVDEVKASVFVGPSWKSIEEITVRWDDGYSVYRITYDVETNDKESYSAELKVREDSENVLVGELDWDKEKGDFKLELTDDWGDTFGLEGSLKADTKTVSIVLDSIYEGSDEIDPGVSLTISASDKMPEMPEYTDILDMTADEVEDLVYELEDVLYGLVGAFYY